MSMADNSDDEWIFCEDTPQKTVFIPNDLLECFLCGTKEPKHLRLIFNDCMRYARSFLPLIKTVLLLDIPPAQCRGCKICAGCIKRLKDLKLFRKRLLKNSVKKRKFEDTPTRIPGQQKKRFIPSSLVSPKHDKRSGILRLSPIKAKRSLEHAYSTVSLFDRAAYLKDILHRNGELTQHVAKLLEDPEIKEEIQRQLCVEIDHGIHSLVSMKTGSILRSGNNELMNIVQSAGDELIQRLPFLFQVLSTVAFQPSKKDINVISLTYAMLMNHRNQTLSAFQRGLTAAVIRHCASNDLLDLLHSFNVTFASSSKIGFLDTLEKDRNEKLHQEFSAAENIKLTVDNIDWRTVASQVRLGSGNKDFHYTHWTVLPDRFTDDDLHDLNDKQPECPTLTPDIFFVSHKEDELLREEYERLTSEILVQTSSSLAFCGDSLPRHEHRFQEVMNRKSVVLPMEVILEPSNKLTGCVQVLQKINQNLHKLYDGSGKGEEFLQKNITVGGDQLTRVNLDSAKNLRLFEPRREDRFANLHPIVAELFHVQQDLLEKIFKKFYSKENSTVIGTLAHLKAVLHRTNVNGEVKGAYEAHRDFASLVAKMLLVEYCDDAIPQKNIPADTSYMRKEKKQKLVSSVASEVVKTLYVPYSNNNDISMLVHVMGDTTVVNIPPTYAGKTISLLMKGHRVQLNVPLSTEKQESVHNNLKAY